MTSTEGISVGVMTRTEGISVRVTRMLVQLVDDFSVERANVFFTRACMSLREIASRSRLRITKIQTLHTLMLQEKLLNSKNTKKNNEFYPREVL